MSKNFSSFTTVTSPPSSTYLVGYNPSTVIETKQTISDVFNNVSITGYNSPYNAGSVAGAFTLNRSNGSFQTLTATATLSANPPTNGFTGSTLRFWLTNGSGGDTTFHMASSILIPTDSGFTWPKTITSGKLYNVALQYNGSAWMLNSLVGGY
jgi:hypothetical protein